MTTLINISQINHPEDLFGNDASMLESEYKKLAKQHHPDMGGSASDFQKLSKLYNDAKEKVSAGTYGTRTLFSFSVRNIIVDVVDICPDFNNPISTGYIGQYQNSNVRISIANNPADNDLVKREFDTLRTIRKQLSEFDKNLLYFFFEPLLISTVSGKMVAVYLIPDGRWFNLQTVKAKMGHALDDKSIAWIWRRVLVALYGVHITEHIHANVVPTNIYIDPDQHGLILHGFYGSTQDKPIILNQEFKSYYPEEITTKQKLHYGIDLYTASYAMQWISDFHLHPILSKFFQGCRYGSKSIKGSNALDIQKEFDSLIFRLWGQRKFHPMYVPN